MGLFDCFPLSNAYSVNLDWIIKQVKIATEEFIKLDKDFKNLDEEFIELKTYVQNYFSSLVLDDAVREELEKMIADGEFEAILQGLLNMVVNVKTFGAVGDGVTDDYQAVVDAIASAGRGGHIYFPQGKYYLSQNPDATDLTVYMDTGVEFVGPGAGDANSGAGLFGTTFVSNPWLRVSANYSNYNLEKVPCPVGGGTYANALELSKPLRSAQEITIRGYLTRGSSYISNVSSVQGIDIGDAIYTEANIPFGNKNSITTVMRVYAIDTARKEITFGVDFGNGSGALEPSVYEGESGLYSFTVRKRYWKGLQYAGLNTGEDANPDKWYWLYNGVVNLHNQPAFGVELDFNTWGNPSEMSRCVSLTGIGNTQAKAVALEIIRGGAGSWSYAIQIANSIVGLDISANQPIYIRASWFNNGNKAVEPIAYGILFDNTDRSHLARPAIACKQLENGAQGITVQRASDTDPRGSLFSATNTDGSAALFNVDAGGVTTLQRLQLQQNVTAQNNLSASGYLTIMDATGKTYKLLVAE